MRLLVVTFLIIFSGRIDAQQHKGTVIKDMKQDWKMLANNQFVDYDQSKYKNTIYFLVDADLYEGGALRIKSEKKFSVFIGGQLITTQENGVLLYDLDSLSSLYSSPISFSIRRPNVVISTELILSNGNAESTELIKRKGNYFMDFSILASLILIIFFVVLLRTNPKLTFDYLNFTKLFSVQEHEENIMALRITSSVNILYYAFTSLFAALLLMVMFHFAYAEISLANIFKVEFLRQGLYQWLWLSGIILGILFVKLILISVLSYLYKATEIAALQFFNFIRLFFFTFGVIAIMMILFFMIKVEDPSWYFNLLFIAAGIFIFWETIIFLKLMNRLSFRFFHLFFYLCASELIPLVILIWVVF
ncbi:MAG: DUF4271 domain-containing protein [Bacteroidia bacterium]|nr:DUF4271 domain-containing protein [Bacteroidia bacterium]